MSASHMLQKSLISLAVLACTTLACAESLDEAWATAMQLDHGLKASHASVSAASSIVDAARAAYAPSVSVAAAHLSTSDPAAIGLMGLQLPIVEKDSSAWAVQAAMPLYTGGRIGSAVQAANAGLQATQAKEAADIQSLRLRVAESYVNVLRASSLLKVAEKYEQSMRSLVHDVEGMHEQGMLVKANLLSAQVALLDARQKVLQASNFVDLTRADFNRTLGRPLDQAVDLSDLNPGDEHEDLEPLTTRALNQREELNLLRHQEDAVRYQADAVKAERQPQVLLVGGYGGTQGSALVHERGAFASIGVKWTLFDGSTSPRESSLRSASAAITEQREDASSAIRLQVRQAWLQLNESRQRLSLTQAAVGQAEESLRVMRDRYVNGLAIHTEVLSTETQKVNADTNHTNARFDVVMSELRLKRAVGQL